VTRSQEETRLVQAILVRFGALPGLRIARMNVGAARDANGRVIRFGVRGMADIMGILAPSGRTVAIECKADGGRLRPHQRAFARMIRAHGGLYILARSVEDVEEALEGAVIEECGRERDRERDRSPR
jgi:hypothetical protein